MKPDRANFVRVLYVCGVGFAAWATVGTTASPAAEREGLSANGRKGLVVSVSRLATEIGVQTLESGGNAVDAAVATAFALAVTFPEAGNIGGGGFMLVAPGGAAEPAVIDYRETAPSSTRKNSFETTTTRLGHQLAGVPGTVRGLALAHQSYGKLSWQAIVAPAAALARNGFVVNQPLADSLNAILDDSKRFAEFQRVLGKHEGREKWLAGDRLVQPDLARTLDRIGHDGPNAFYEGEIAGQIVAEMQAGDGWITRADLANYRARLRPALHGTFRGYDVYCPPAQAGGICLIEMLNILENFDLRRQGRWSPETLHLCIEAMRRAYADRARHLGDPDFTTIPDKLTRKDYARKIASEINRLKATPSAEVAPDIPLTDAGPQTTHFSVIDASGMAVANTYTLEQSYGSRVIVRGAGFLLNDEMGDFNWRPGYTDRRGAIGTPANQVAPGKRMLSSQTPTIVMKNGAPVLITGTPGGRTIINTVLCVVLNVLEFEMTPRDAVDSPRLHHQWFPDRISCEAGLHRDHAAALKQLREMGHEIYLYAVRQGDAHTIHIDPASGQRTAIADPRRDGWAAGQ